MSDTPTPFVPEGMRLAELNVIDATVYEDIDNDNPVYHCGIHITFQDVETRDVFQSFLSDADIQTLIGADVIPNSRELDRVARWLADDPNPVTLCISDDDSHNIPLENYEQPIDNPTTTKFVTIPQMPSVKQANSVSKEAMLVGESTHHIKVGYRRFRAGAFAPTRATQYSAGFDLYAWVSDADSEEDDTSNDSRCVVIERGQMRVIQTGLNLRIPLGYEVQVRPRSGLAFKHQVTVMNSPGTIDADYDGDGEKYELKIMLINHGEKPFTVRHGDRIAQIVVKRVPIVEMVEVYGDNPLRHESTRHGGFGSTGTS